MKANIKTVREAIARHGGVEYGSRTVKRVEAVRGGWEILARDESMHTGWYRIARATGRQTLTRRAAELLAHGTAPAGEMARLHGRD